MTNAIEDYIKLAEGATEGPWELKTDDDYYSQVHSTSGCICCNTTYYPTAVGIEDMQFIAASRTLGPAMAKALLEAEEALKMSSGTGTHSATRIVVDQALAAIQHVKEGGD